LCSKLTLSGRATVCCLSWARSSDGAAASPGVFTMQGQGVCPAGASRFWIHLRRLLGLGLDGGTMGDSYELTSGQN
jgi:hypothetical protein